ncbi:MAG: ATP phosphoribosyltransferase regulatory subunit, partial [Thermomicrobiales bacterium]|nr:ATP phosphoribosyltransferase regulatory subunit [Thermomicrobiales bacterium]
HMILRQRIIGIFRDIFEKHGFEPLDTPALEHIEVLLGKAGENEKLMYRFRDQGDREIGLRYDLTVPLARVVAQHQNEIVLPFKRYHIAPVWRAEKPQRGRFREFWQCDADIVGSSSMIADAEAVSIAAEAMTAVGLPNFVIQISHRRLLEGIAVTSGVAPDLAGTVYRSVDKLAKIGANGVLKELTDGGVGDPHVDVVHLHMYGEDPVVVENITVAESDRHGSLLAFVSALQGGELPAHTGRDNLNSLATVMACVESVEQGRIVSVGERLG